MNQPIENTNTQSETTKSFAPFITGALVAIATPGAYMVGLRYYQGYLNGFGVDSDLFPKSAPDIYILAYQVVGFLGLALSEATRAAFTFLTTAPGLWGTLSLFAVLVVALAARLKKEEKTSSHAPHRFHKFKSFQQRLHWKNNRIVQSFGIAGLLYYVLLLILFLPVALTVLWWVIPLSAYQKGEMAAAEQILAFQKKGCNPNSKNNWNACSTLINKEGKALREGILVAVNEKDVAIFAKDGVEIIGRQEGFVLRRIRH